MLRIAVASDNGAVSGHFGHCNSFLIVDTEGEKIVAEKTIPNPGHRPGFLPRYLSDMGVKVIISGGMGGGAVEIFQNNGVEVVTGASGNARSAVEAYVQGRLKSSNSICHEHQHRGECGE